MSIKHKEEKDFIKEVECDHCYPIGNNKEIKRCGFCDKEKVIIFFELDGYHDKESFLLGQKSSFEDKNPFKKNTNSWFNWNRGKNTNNN